MLSWVSRTHQNTLQFSWSTFWDEPFRKVDYSGGSLLLNPLLISPFPTSFFSHLFFKQHAHPPPPPIDCLSEPRFTILWLECFSPLTFCSPPPLGPRSSLISLSPPFSLRPPLLSYSLYLSPPVSSICSILSLSWVSLLSYILQPSAAFLFTPFCIFYITLLCFLTPPLFPLLLVSLPVSVSGHQPHTWLIDFQEHHTNTLPMHGLQICNREDFGCIRGCGREKKRASSRPCREL